ncbi:helix-turn-helix domain-containing protein [Anaerobranca gottschalkii]|uniref:Helix-turn-helix domain-containing protein n=1 Tax=Anaerobranca gottschalkii DSM 13577 TaxID=1120990 RepID=A0A1H9Z7Y2_9FIRM|nr:helix-turn-helix domain-containing protein [Anaerobranca gottschalkii]SES77660.1 Helix-turn-helix domain-containing protein [Anaerobranca gottschalkii DSM 13577]
MDFKEIGKQLRESRELKGLTIEDIVNKTKLRKDQIIAIEEGNIEKLPPGPYIKGFIKLYAKAVNLEIYEETATATTLDSPVSSRKKREPIKRSTISIDYNGIIFFIVLATFLALAVYLIVGYIITPKNNIEIPNNHPIIIPEEEENEVDEEDVIEEVHETIIELEIRNNKYYYTVLDEEKLEVQFIVQGQCWVDIKVDNQNTSIKRGIMEDEELLIEADNQIIIQAGLAKNATIIINGVQVEFSDNEGRTDAIITLEKSGE